jgi:hypothetical protein
LRAARLPAVIVRCEADGSLMYCAGLVILCAPVAEPASSWPGHGCAGGGREHYRRGVAPQPSSGAGRPRFAHHAAEMAAFGPGSVLFPLVLAGRRSSRPPVRPSGRLAPGRPRRNRCATPITAKVSQATWWSSRWILSGVRSPAGLPGRHS